MKFGMRIFLLLLLLQTGALVFSHSHPAAAQTASETPEAAQEAHWRERAQSLRDNLKAAEARYAEAQKAYAKMHNKPLTSGPEEHRLFEEVKNAKTAIEQAQQALDAFPEEARRGGALPGWIRE